MAKRRRTKSANYVKLSYVQLAIVAVLLILAAFFLVNKVSHGKPNVLGVATSSYRGYTVRWFGAPGAKGYNIYYKTSGEKNWSNAVRELPKEARDYTINYLAKNKKYEYSVKAYDWQKKEYWSTSGSIPTGN